MTTPPSKLPAPPEGADITAWAATLPDMPLSPRMAMIVMMHVTWLRWAELAGLLHDQMLDPVVTTLDGEQVDEGNGLVGHRWAMDPKSSQLYATGEEVRALAALEGEERDRVMRYAQQCHDAGLLGEDW